MMTLCTTYCGHGFSASIKGGIEGGLIYVGGRGEVLAEAAVAGCRRPLFN